MAEGAPKGPGLWVYALMLAMLLSGTANTLLMKFQTRLRVPPSVGAAPAGFVHPVTQTLFMLLGEVLCFLVYVAQVAQPLAGKQSPKANDFPKSVMAIPAVCDLIATTLVHIAYIYIPASVAQMCRGSIVIFACAFSMIFLGRRQHPFHFAGVGLVAAGIFVVALAAHHGNSHASSAASRDGGGAILGIILCIGAQLFHASMFVVEEKFMKSYTIPPLQAVGLEGVFGSAIVVVVLVIMNFTGFENTHHAIYQMQHSGPLVAAICCSIVSIACFNWSGISITKHSSCVARATIDGSRTIFIWVIELGLMWNNFKVLQLVGFIMLAMGTLIYNRIIEVRSIFHYPGEEETKLVATPVANKTDDGHAKRQDHKDGV